MATTSQGEMKKTLSLTGLTINAMALIAPGAFLWTTFQLQAAQTSGGSTTGMDMLPGLLFVLILAFLTAYSYSELANLYPQAGAGSSYYFAEAAFLDKEKKAHFQFARLSKFVVGWISHLYYWVYPGIMVAFTGTLLVYILSLFNVTLNQPGEIAAVVIFSALTGYIAFRGISGSTMTAIVINVIQLTALVGFSVLAIIFRLAHPELHYAHSGPFSVVLPHNMTNVLMQGTIAILLLVGFESVTALGAEAINPKRDVRRAILLSLAIQGAVAYVFEYFAANFFVNESLTATVGGKVVKGLDAAAASGAPIGDMVRYIGDNMLGGTGFALTLILAATVLVALIGTTLACLNTGVRITYVMGRDKEMPSILGLLHGKYATPALRRPGAGGGLHGLRRLRGAQRRQPDADHPGLQHRHLPGLRDDQPDRAGGLLGQGRPECHQTCPRAHHRCPRQPGDAGGDRVSEPRRGRQYQNRHDHRDRDRAGVDRGWRGLSRDQFGHRQEEHPPQGAPRQDRGGGGA